MNTESKYQQLVEEITNSEKFFQFMEQKFFVNSMKLSTEEVWKIVQDLASKVIEKHKLNPIGIQSWIVHLKSVWNDNSEEEDYKVSDEEKDKKEEKWKKWRKKSSSSSSSSSSSPSSSSSSSPQPPRKRKRTAPPPPPSSSSSSSSSSASSEEETSDMDSS